MAKLTRRSDGTEVTVPAQCLVGRSTSCLIRIDERYASSEHAKLIWMDTRWVLRDLGSRNGTFVDGRRVEPGQSVALVAGSTIGFGQEAPTHELSDASPPGALAIDLSSGEIVAARGDVLLLPSDAAPEISVYAQAKGLGWVVEDAKGGVREVNDRQVLSAGGRTFRIELPVIAEATPLVAERMSVENVAFRFRASRNEERVMLDVISRGRAHTLERREHNFLLLTLARLRLAEASLPVEERGWRTIEELSKMMRQEPTTLNVAIHRARQQLAAFGVQGAAGIVESRSGKRRFGSDRIELAPLED